MNTHQITSILKTDSFSKMFFQGVMPRDIFLKTDIHPGIYICNTDPSDKPGEHWVAIQVDSSFKCEYFDSYGIKPFYKDLHSKLESIDQHFLSNKFCLQGLTTTVCGDYCIVYTLLKSRGYTLSSIINIFSTLKTTEARDHIVRYFTHFTYPEISSSKSDIHVQAVKPFCEMYF